MVSSFSPDSPALIRCPGFCHCISQSLSVSWPGIHFICYRVKHQLHLTSWGQKFRKKKIKKKKCANKNWIEQVNDCNYLQYNCRKKPPQNEETTLEGDPCTIQARTEHPSDQSESSNAHTQPNSPPDHLHPLTRGTSSSRHSPPGWHGRASWFPSFRSFPTLLSPLSSLFLFSLGFFFYATNFNWFTSLQLPLWF